MHQLRDGGTATRATLSAPAKPGTCQHGHRHTNAVTGVGCPRGEFPKVRRVLWMCFGQLDFRGHHVGRQHRLPETAHGHINKYRHASDPFHSGMRPALLDSTVNQATTEPTSRPHLCSVCSGVEEIGKTRSISNAMFRKQVLGLLGLKGRPRADKHFPALESAQAARVALVRLVEWPGRTAIVRAVSGSSKHPCQILALPAIHLFEA